MRHPPNKGNKYLPIHRNCDSFSLVNLIIIFGTGFDIWDNKNRYDFEYTNVPLTFVEMEI